MKPRPEGGRSRRRGHGEDFDAASWRAIELGAHVMHRLAPPGTDRSRLYRRGVALLHSRAVRHIASALLRRLAGGGEPYDLWLERHEPGPEELLRGREEARAWEGAPRIALVTVVKPGSPGGAAALRATLHGVRQQSYPWTRHVLVCAGRPGDAAARLLEAALHEGAVVVRQETDAGTAAARNAGLAAAAAADLVGVVEPGEVLQPYALLEAARLVRVEPDADLLYTDQDELDASGRRSRPLFKPDWNPELLLSTSYLGRLTLVRAALLRELGGFRPGFPGDPDYDLALRATERARRVAHLPLPAASVPAGTLPAARPPPSRRARRARGQVVRAEAGRLALEDALRRRGWDARAEHAPRPAPAGFYRTRFAVTGDPLVSILIPTRDRRRLLERCVASIERLTRHPRWEVLILDNGSVDPGALAYLQRTRHGVLRCEGGFNFAALNNRGARSARGDLLLFLNNDVEVLGGGWLDALVEQAQRPEVGPVGARLLFPGGGVQHMGVVLGIGGVACHGHMNLPPGEPGYGGFALAVRNWSAVTGACLMIRAELFRRLGGFDEELRVAYNDVDLCLRASEAGYRTVCTPYAELAHHQGASRGRLHPASDDARMRERWADLLARGDPCYSPNLTLSRWDFSVDPGRGYRRAAQTGVAERATGAAMLARAIRVVPAEAPAAVD